ncbi:unnamed protein product [Pleuronectes platessa]|uniref:Uncharacterized protein n=1 Tax=Pleuronectes platessa TaxID=8262 RepID=A0A9N7US32_PLEPL|nr:unnamed protein product [Pleuronectes platessa]
MKFMKEEQSHDRSPPRFPSPFQSEQVLQLALECISSRARHHNHHLHGSGASSALLKLTIISPAPELRSSVTLGARHHNHHLTGSGAPSPRSSGAVSVASSDASSRADAGAPELRSSPS